jgi:hypothetical protein
MPFLLILASALASVIHAADGLLDVSKLRVAPATTVAELDLGKLKGDLQQICWSPDGKQIYVETADSGSVLATPHHYLVSAAGGAVAGLDVAPAWAAAYWNMKSYKSAPGIDALAIEVNTGRKKGDAGVPKEGVYDADGGGVRLGATNPTMTQNISVGVIQLQLLEETVGEFVNTKPVPGLTFGWGPENSGAIAFVDHDGRLMLMDQRKHKTMAAGTKDATLPAWSTDGSQLVWAQKTARKKYALMVAQVGE